MQIKIPLRQLLEIKEIELATIEQENDRLKAEMESLKALTNNIYNELQATKLELANSKQRVNELNKRFWLS